MEPLTPEQWADLLTSCERSACHLEMRDWYTAEDEQERFRRFLAKPISPPIFCPTRTAG